MIYYIHTAEQHEVPMYMWVSPDGTYVPVDYGDHFAEAIGVARGMLERGEITEYDYKNIGAEKVLEDKGWVRVNYLGYQMGDGFKLTDKQLPIILTHYEEYKDVPIHSLPELYPSTKTLLDRSLERIL